MRVACAAILLVASLAHLAFGSNVPRADATIQGCNNNDHCIYPAHSVPDCKPFHPCSFTCKDGYDAWPSFGIPVLCKCDWPKKVCPNGKCAKSCPSNHPYKRDLGRQCRRGMTACGIPGRGTRSWECLDTQTNLESCGGCAIGLGLAASDGVDCTAIDNVFDVSCLKGKCVIHKCRPGYIISEDGHFCEKDGENPLFLAAKYGFEQLHVGAL